jgi:hypothetical protein
MKLEAHEKQTALWQKLESYIEQRIDTLRRMNDSELDPIQTARLRGRIVELKALVALSKDEQPLEAVDV